MQDTSTTAGREHGIFGWAGIAVTSIALLRILGQFVSWLVRILFVNPLSDRMDGLDRRIDRQETSLKEMHQDVVEIHPKLDAMARAIQRMEIRDRDKSLGSVVDDPDFPVQLTPPRDHSREAA